MLVTVLALLFVYLYEGNRQRELDRQLEIQIAREKIEFESIEREKDRQLKREKIKRERELQEP